MFEIIGMVVGTALCVVTGLYAAYCDPYAKSLRERTKQEHAEL